MKPQQKWLLICVLREKDGITNLEINRRYNCPKKVREKHGCPNDQCADPNCPNNDPERKLSYTDNGGIRNALNEFKDNGLISFRPKNNNRERKTYIARPPTKINCMKMRKYGRIFLFPKSREEDLTYEFTLAPVILENIEKVFWDVGRIWNGSLLLHNIGGLSRLTQAEKLQFLKKVGIDSSSTVSDVRKMKYDTHRVNFFEVLEAYGIQNPVVKNFNRYPNIDMSILSEVLFIMRSSPMALRNVLFPEIIVGEASIRPALFLPSLLLGYMTDKLTYRERKMLDNKLDDECTQYEKKELSEVDVPDVSDERNS